MMNNLATGHCKKTGCGILIMAVFFLFGVMPASAEKPATAEGAIKFFGDVNAPTKIDPNLLPLQLVAGSPDEEIGLNTIKPLVEAGAIINKLGPDGDSALHTASWRGNAKNIELLVKLGADPNLRNKKGETPFHQAVDSNQVKSVLALIKAGADPYALIEIDTRVGIKKYLPFQVYVLNDAEQAQNMIKVLVEAGVDINRLGPDGDSALHTASWREVEKNIGFLVKLGADPNLKNKQGETPLHKAISYRKYKSVVALLNAGANPNVADAEGVPVVHKAADMGDVEMALKILPLLIKHGGDIHAVDKNGRTALQVTIYSPWVGDKAVMQFLLDSGADPNLNDSEGKTPLYALATSNATDKLVPLIELFIKNGADVNRMGGVGSTALHGALWRACSYGELEITRTLLKYGANINIKNSKGVSALDQASKCSKPIQQLVASYNSGQKPTPSVKTKKPIQKNTDTKKKKANDRLNKAIKAYVEHVDKKGRAYQQAKQKAAQARGFSGLKTRQDVQARQKLFADFKDKSMALIYLLKESKSLAWKAVQENKIEATKKEVEAAIVRKFGKRITEDGLQPLKAQFYWADAYYNVFTMLDQRWGAWSVDAGKHTLNASDKSLQAKLNKEMKAIADLESYLNQQSK